MIVAVGCAKVNECGGQQFDSDGQLIPVNVKSMLNVTSTKTSLSEGLGDYKINWEEGDKIGMYISGRQSNVLLEYDKGTSGDFSGYIKGGYPKSTANIEYVGYYPYRNADKSGTISALLNRIQTAPFDSTLDYMVSEKFSAPYNESEMPSVRFKFSNHLFSIIKISVINDLESLKNEKLTAVMLSSDNTVLSGYFSFNPLDDCNAVFSKDKSETYNEVVSVYPEDKQPILGIGKEHVLYFIVNSTQIPDLKVTVSTTDGHARVFQAKSLVTLERNMVLEPETLELSKANKIIVHKVMALWGDSITAALTYRYSIQRELEPFWTVIKCGVNGDNSLGIAARQGGIQFVTGKDFTINDGTTQVDFGGFFTRENLFGETVDENDVDIFYNVSFTPWFNHPLRSPWINPIRIELPNGGYIDCETSLHASGVYCLVPTGDYTSSYPIYIPKGSKFNSYGSRILDNADMTIIYSGTNGGYRGETDAFGHYTGYDQLIHQQKAMVNHLKKKEAYLVLGYHFNSSITGQRNDTGETYDIQYWTEDYRTTMSNAFERHFLDLKTEGSRNGEKLLLETSVITSVNDMSPEDQNYISNEEFPASFTDNPKYDVHPNEYGNRAIAILIRERMKELGLL